MTEQWRPIPGYEGYYEVSDQGHVRSVPRTIQHPKSGPTRIPGRPLKAWLDRHGYPTLRLCRYGREKSFGVHQLVMFAFVGPRPEGMEVRHLDGVRTNAVLSNLAYGTPAENGWDRVLHHTHCAKGHAYLPEDAGRRQRCRECRHAKERRRYARRTRRSELKRLAS